MRRESLGAVRLKNGNTLVSGNGDGWVREVNPKDSIVWQVTKTELKDSTGATITFGTVQECDRLANGNTVICLWEGDPAVVEVTPQKKVVWEIPEKTFLYGTSIQLLDEPGVPEKVGDLQR